MKVAILGTGIVGQTLARGLIGLGHDAVFGSRDTNGETAKKALAAVAGARIATFADAARQADFAVLATPWSGTDNAIRLTGPQNLGGKLVIDATNPLDYASGPRLSIGFTTSAGEQVQAMLTAAKVVKAFNSVGVGQMIKPNFPEGRPTMFIAGNDAAAKKTVSGILDSFLWDAVDLGGIDGARLIEAHAMLWITYGVQNNHWSHAFRLLGRK